MATPSYVSKHKINQKQECAGASCSERVKSFLSTSPKKKTKKSIPAGGDGPVKETKVTYKSPEEKVRFTHMEPAVAGGPVQTQERSSTVGTAEKVNVDPNLITKFKVKKTNGGTWR